MALIANEMGASLDKTTDQFIREAVTVHNGKGRGYALSTEDELDFILQFSLETGIALDPVYSGKALYHFVKHVVENDVESYRNKNVLFWHTGGALGIYEKGNDLLHKFSEVSPVKRVDVYGLNGVKEITD
jgi:1-aminocyclopropane-1-carboxylate deaminase/D-cysteine desulfhydrase-like pyridoxal-dependent ACC family enzyme